MRNIDVVRWSPEDQHHTTELWRAVMEREPEPALLIAARDVLESDPPFRVCLHILQLFPAYLTTPAKRVVDEFLNAHALQIDANVLAQIGEVFVDLWRRPPGDVYWYGDLRQSMVPYVVQQRLAEVPAVQSQLIDDFRTLAPTERVASTDLGCRRLERAAELLLHAPSEACRTVLGPIVELDRIDSQHTRPLATRYETVYWGMLRILRKLGVDL